jgi:hypothetical protein
MLGFWGTDSGGTSTWYLYRHLRRALEGLPGWFWRVLEAFWSWLELILAASGRFWWALVVSRGRSWALLGGWRSFGTSAGTWTLA